MHVRLVLNALYVTGNGLEFLIFLLLPPKGPDYRYGSLCPVYAVWGSHSGFPACKASMVLTELHPQPSTLVFKGKSPDGAPLLAPFCRKGN